MQYYLLEKDGNEGGAVLQHSSGEESRQQVAEVAAGELRQVRAR